MRADLPLDKNYGKSGLGHPASRPPGRSGPRAAGLSWAVGRGPWAVDRGPWAVGRGPWAAGLFLAKPKKKGVRGPLGHFPKSAYTISHLTTNLCMDSERFSIY